MRPGSRDTVLFIAYLLAGLVAATLAGWLTLGNIIFRQSAFLIRYLAVGFSGALIYVSVRQRGVLLALAMVGVLLAGNILLTRSWTATALLEACVWSLLAGTAYLSAALLFRAMDRLFLGKFLFMAAFLGTAYAVGAMLVLAFRGRTLNSGVILNPALAGLRLGALSGFLFEVVDFIGIKLAGKTARAD